MPDAYPDSELEQYAKRAVSLYHGSTRGDLDELRANQPNLGGAGVYGADNLDWAALYALAKDRRGMAVLGGSSPKLLINKANQLAPEGYVYEYASDTATAPPADDPNRGWHVPGNTKPLRKHIVKLVDHMKNIEQFEDKAALRQRWAELNAKRAAESSPRTAVIIRGNPKFVDGNPKATAFYAKLQKHLEQQGYAVSQDPGEPHTVPPAANLWLAHSRGVDRLPYAPEGTRGIALGAPGGINHPDDTAMAPGDVPTAAHYKLTPKMLKALDAFVQEKSAAASNDDDLHARFQPDYTPEQLENLGVYDSLYRNQAPRLASLGEWKPEWVSEHDPKGWAQWYKRYTAGRRIPGEDERQIKRWLSFKARHGGPFSKNPTARRGWALRNWAVDPSKLVPDQAQQVNELLDEHQRKAMQKYVKEKAAAEKEAAPKWVKLVRAGKLSPEALARITASMPEGSMRFIKSLGRGTFNQADLMAGKLRDTSGLIVRKLPRHNLSQQALRTEAARSLEGSRILTRQFPGISARYLRGSGAKGVFQEFGNKPVVPNWLTTFAPNLPSITDKGFDDLFINPKTGLPHAFARREALENAAVQRARKVYQPLLNFGVKDIRPDNLGPGGQLIDYQLPLSGGRQAGGSGDLLRGHELIPRLPGADQFKARANAVRKYWLGRPKTAALSPDINHPDDTAMAPGDVPTAAHYKLTPEMLKALDAFVQEKSADVPALATQFISDAELMGSRGRARMYGRPEPEDRDHDYIVFTDDVKKHNELRQTLRTLAQQHGYKLKQRSGGFLTASGNNTDLSFYPTARRDLIHKAWALQEAGMSKDDAWAKQAKTFYHGSPDADLQTLRAGSYITPDLETAKLMGRFHADTGKTWSDDDLAEKHKFGAQPKWKQGREPTGAPTVYKLRAAIKQLNLLNNPHEHTTLEELPVAKIAEQAWAQRGAVFPVSGPERVAEAEPGQAIRVAPALSKLAAEKYAALSPDVELQEHQQRVADRVSGEDPRLLVYHGLGSGKSLSAIAAAEMARRNSGGQYGIVVPASLRGNFQKELAKFAPGSNPEILSYSGLALGKKFQSQPETLVMDEAQRLRNPESAASRAAREAAQKAKRLVLLSGTPITNSPTDMASMISMLTNRELTPKEFEQRYIGYKSKFPGVIPWLRGAQWGEVPYVKNEKELRKLLEGRVDYHPSKTPEGVNVQEEVIKTPLTKAQQKIQKAIRTKVPPGFLWKLDKEFPMSREELAKMNSFLNGLRQVSLSTQSFRGDRDPLKAFDQSGKLQTAMSNLQKALESDERKKALIYSNFVESGVNPYAAALERAGIPHGIFHGGISPEARQKALKEYNEGKLRALLIGPAGAEGISTKGTNLIQLLDPHWNEARIQQARGRGLRFDSHAGLPEDLKNVQVQRYLSGSDEPGFLGKLMGQRRQRTGDEVLENLAANKEQLNEAFRKILREVGAPKRKPEEETTAESQL